MTTLTGALLLACCVLTLSVDRINEWGNNLTK